MIRLQLQAGARSWDALAAGPAFLLCCAEQLLWCLGVLQLWGRQLYMMIIRTMLLSASVLLPANAALAGLAAR